MFCFPHLSLKWSLGQCWKDLKMEIACFFHLSLNEGFGKDEQVEDDFCNLCLHHLYWNERKYKHRGKIIDFSFKKNWLMKSWIYWKSQVLKVPVLSKKERVVMNRINLFLTRHFVRSKDRFVKLVSRSLKEEMQPTINCI